MRIDRMDAGEAMEGNLDVASAGARGVKTGEGGRATDARKSGALKIDYRIECHYPYIP